MAAVELLATGAQSRTGESTPVDVSDHALLRLDVTARADMGKVPQADIWIETGRSADGPWHVASHIRLHAGQPPTSPSAWPADSVTRVTLGTVDGFARVRWVARATANSADGDPGLTLGVDGVGIGGAEV